jgi:hypothetical protein
MRSSFRGHSTHAQLIQRAFGLVQHVIDLKHGQAHGFDPADYLSPADVASLLDQDWALEVDEERPRHVATGAGAHHTRDVVLRARRLR